MSLASGEAAQAGAAPIVEDTSGKASGDLRTPLLAALGALRGHPSIIRFDGHSLVLVRSQGEVYGLDLRAEWRRAPVYLFAGYGLSAAYYRNAREDYRPPHDRRHRLQLAAEVERGPYRLAARWQLAATTRDCFFSSIRKSMVCSSWAALILVGVSVPVATSAPIIIFPSGSSIMPTLPVNSGLSRSFQEAGGVANTAGS